MSHRLLIIEDDQRIVDLVANVANEVGFIARSTTGETAIAVYDNFEPHGVVLDILMPEVDGLEVLQALKVRGSETRIIILSGSQNSYRHMAESLGTAHGLIIEANLAKPFRLAELRGTLARMRSSLDTNAKRKEKIV